MLADRDILSALANGYIRIDPFDHETMLQPASVDVHLGNTFRTFDNHVYAAIDPTLPPDDLTTEMKVEYERPFVLHPGEFVLASTQEVVTLGHFHVARLEGKSSRGRIGLIVHATAGFIDPGFSGEVTLELSNIGPIPILLRPGTPIGQLAFFRTESPVMRAYGSEGLRSKYHGQRGPTPAR